MFGVDVMDIVVIFVYLAAMIGIGVWSRFRSNTQEDFFMGNRSFGKLLQTMAAFGAGTSADNPIGTARNTYAGGLAGIWTTMTWLLCTPFYWFIGLWMRRTRLLTTGDFFAERYQSMKLGSLYALFGFFFFTIYMAMGFTAVGKTVLAITPKPVAEYSVEEQYELEQFNRMKELERRDYAMMTDGEQQELLDLRDLDPQSRQSHFDPMIIILLTGIVTLIYGVLGGLTAAYLSDLIQGIFIIILSLILIPFAMHKISVMYGGESLWDAFSILHSHLPNDFFQIFGSPHATEFTWYYILIISVMNLAGIITQPHFIVTGGGSAKDEYTARVGLVSGNLLKRFCTVFWSLTALLAITLYAGVVADPDYIWGYATRDLLGPLGIGLVGLMMACLFAALMSSVSAYMLCTGALIVKNIVRPIVPDKSEGWYVSVGKFFAAFTVVFAMWFAIYYDDVFSQIRFTWEIPTMFAGAMWLGMLWRRATAKAAWISVTVSIVTFFVIPALMPVFFSSMRTNPEYLVKNNPPQVSISYDAKELDVKQRSRDIATWDERSARGETMQVSRPALVHVGDPLTKDIKPTAKSIYWTLGIITELDGAQHGEGFFNWEMLLFRKIGLNPQFLSNSLIETLRLPFRLGFPFLLMVLISLFTKPVDKVVTDRFYVRMKTKVSADKEKDRAEMEKSYADPSRFDHLKLFPKSNWEFQKWDGVDSWGFAISWALTLSVIGLAALVGSIGG
jgi:solute:Na+ symporter, SSS family